MNVQKSALSRRADRALERQLDYQRKKAASIEGREQDVVAAMIQASREVREKLEKVKPIGEDAKVLEVGSGAHGLIFYFGVKDATGVDPLADHYRTLFPAWQTRVKTIAAPGEKLPFENDSFDVVLCDNVIDHAEGPGQIVRELVRVLKPGGLLYFCVNFHHPLYHVAATAHAGWRAIGIPFEITPFADHTVHLTLDAARGLFKGLPLRFVEEWENAEEVKRRAPAERARHMGDRLKRFFFKNAQYRLIAVKRG